MEPTPYNFDLLDRRAGKFVLWIPGSLPDRQNPQLVLGTYTDTGSHKLTVLVDQDLEQSTEHPALWELALDQLSVRLVEEQVYHYWFRVQDTSPESHATTLQLVTDPLAFALDYRICMNDDTRQRAPAAVVKYRQGKLWPCDIHGREPKRAGTPAPALLPANEQLVIYELPTSWVRSGPGDIRVEVDKGTFADVRALFDGAEPGDRFTHVAAVGEGSAVLTDLGVNAVELLPAADAKPTGEWGYATAHYFAPDADLGTAGELARLSETMQEHGVRFFTDVVMAFGHDPYRFIDFPTFHIRPTTEPWNRDSYQSGNNGNQLRQDWGGENWRYINQLETYDPRAGQRATITPARVFHIAHLTRWMTDFGVSGLRLDSVNNTGSWDFVREYRAAAWALWHRGAAPQTPSQASKFLVIGEELSMPGGMLHGDQDGPEPCLDALWNDPWQKRVRAAVVGSGALGDNFEWTVRKMVDSREDRERGFSDLAQAVNYITSHDVEGPGHERLCNYLWNCGVSDAERRAKLAYVCLLTSFGIPMILAGEEFCDVHDLPIREKKQIDPVNWGRLEDDWRRRVFDYVKRLVAFRTNCPALSQNDTSTFHVDQSRGGRIVAWKRGGQDTHPVIVVANFSSEDTPGSEYYVPNWQDRGRDGWREITQGRSVPREWVGREPLMHWEAKVYTY